MNFIDKYLQQIESTRNVAAEASSKFWAAVDPSNSVDVQKATNMVLACNQAREYLDKAQAIIRDAAEENGFKEGVTATVQDLQVCYEAPSPYGQTQAPLPRGHQLTLDLAKKRPRACLIERELIQSRTWKGIYTELCAYLYASNQAQFRSLAFDETFGPKRKDSFRRDFGINDDLMRNPVPVGGIFMEAFGSARLQVRRIMKILDKFTIPQEQVQIFIANEEDSIKAVAKALQDTPDRFPVGDKLTGKTHIDMATATLKGKRVTPDSDFNPYRENTQFWQVFEELKNGRFTKDELTSWLADLREDHSKTAANAAVNVVTSPVRKESYLRQDNADIRGNASAQGHLYYVECDANGKLQAFIRPTPLEKQEKNK